MKRDVDFLKQNIIAHRGDFGEIDTRENSLSAFKRAMDNNYIIELDVHLTKDNRIIVFHDDDLSRMTGRSGNIVDFTLDELKRFRLHGSDERIPTLEEVLDLVNGKVPIIIEIKYDRRPGELEPFLAKILDNYKGKFAVKSFNPMIVRWFKKNRPDYIRGILIAYTYNNIVEKIASRLLFIPLCKPDFISCDFKFYDYKWLKRLREKYVVIAWTIKSRYVYCEIKNYFDNFICENMDNIFLNT